MKVITYLSYVFSFLVLSVFIIAQEKPIEHTGSHENISESIADAKSLQNEAQERINQAKREQREAKTDQEKNDASLREGLASVDFYKAQIQEQEGVLALANKKNDIKSAQKAQQQIDQANKHQKRAQENVTELSRQLAKEFVSEKIADIATDSDLLNYAQRLGVGGYGDEIIGKKLEYVVEIHSKVKELFDDSAINNQVAAKKTVQEKLGFLDAKRMALEDFTELVQRELDGFAARSTAHEVSDQAKKYQRSLEEVVRFATGKKALFDMGRVLLEEQNINFFSRIVTAVKDWFNSTFEFHKKPWYKRSVDDEISKLRDINKQVGTLQKGNIGNFSDRVYDISRDVETLEHQFNDYKDGKHSLDLDQFSEDITKLQKGLESFDVKEAQSAVDVYNTLYSESLQPMMGDISAKLRRYRDPKFVTLFDQMADYYSSDSIFGSTSYKPEQAYQALFTPEIIDRLTTKNSGLNLSRAMFDPLTFNPETISPELIDKAYAESRTFYKEGTSAWRAARNASFLLRNPVDRVTYDAFLADYKTVLSQGVKNPYTGKTDKQNSYLNDNGALSKLQITQATQQQIVSLWGDVLTTISQTKSYFDDIATNIDRLTTSKQKITSLQQDITAFAQSREQGILSNNA